MSDDSYNEEHLEEDQNPSEDGEDENATGSKTTGKKSADDAKFVDILVSFGKILLEKSQTPSVKQKKKKAAKEMCLQLLIQHGIDMSVQQITKKINNMRQRIKVKTDRKQTGNRKIILTELERKFFQLMGGVENPSVSKRSYGVSIGVSARNECPQTASQTAQQTTLETSQNENSSEDEATDDHNRSVFINQVTHQRDPKQNSSQKTLLEEQLKLIKSQQEYTAQLQAQQDERHEKEMEILVLKRRLTLLKIQQIEDSQ